MCMTPREQQGGGSLYEVRSSVGSGWHRRARAPALTRAKAQPPRPVPGKPERRSSSRALYDHLSVSGGLSLGLSLDGPRCCGLHVPSYQRKARGLPCHDLLRPTSHTTLTQRGEGPRQANWYPRPWRRSDLIGQLENMGRSDWAAREQGAI